MYNCTILQQYSEQLLNCTVYCIVSAIQCTVQRCPGKTRVNPSVASPALYTVLYTLYIIVHCTVQYILYCTLSTVHCTFYWKYLVYLEQNSSHWRPYKVETLYNGLDTETLAKPPLLCLWVMQSCMVGKYAVYYLSRVDECILVNYNV